MSVMNRLCIPSSSIFILHNPDIMDSMTIRWNETLGLQLLIPYISTIQPSDVRRSDHVTNRFIPLMSKVYQTILIIFRYIR